MRRLENLNFSGFFVIAYVCFKTYIELF